MCPPLFKKLPVSVILTVIVIGAVATTFFGIVPVALEKNEIVDCLKLQAQSKQFELFYLTQSESEMCDRNGIEIAAPVSDSIYDK